MIISNLIGGLGNQMFQHACGRALACDLQQPLKVSTDLFAGYALHQGLVLGQVFALELDVASAADLRQMLGGWRSGPLLRRAFSRWPLPTWASGRYIAETPAGTLDELRLRASRGAYLHGYWQSERYFVHRRAEVLADYRWRAPLSGRNAELARQIQATPRAISVHVRRGDYISNAKNQGIYASCSPDYYFAALERLSASAPDARVYAFSDDPAWVAQALAPRCPGLVVVDHNRGADSAIDMRLMSLCRHHVIANSSFSWWGAWLNSAPDKQVIAPKRWYADGREDGGLVPADWMRL